MWSKKKSRLLAWLSGQITVIYLLKRINIDIENLSLCIKMMTKSSMNVGLCVSCAYSIYSLFVEQICLIWGKFGIRCSWHSQVDMAGRELDMTVLEFRIWQNRLRPSVNICLWMKEHQGQKFGEEQYFQSWTKEEKLSNRSERIPRSQWKVISQNSREDQASRKAWSEMVNATERSSEIRTGQF